MIIVMKPGAPLEECNKIKTGLEKQGFYINESRGVNFCIFGVVGDTSMVDKRRISANDWVEKIMA
ncbi:MAG: 3-deoxy-7-phosphoheptulonate synthase, partial [Acidaminococcaceae bacterium]